MCRSEFVDAHTQVYTHQTSLWPCNMSKVEALSAPEKHQRIKSNIRLIRGQLGSWEDFSAHSPIHTANISISHLKEVMDKGSKS